MVTWDAGVVFEAKPYWYLDKAILVVDLVSEGRSGGLFFFLTDSNLCYLRTYRLAYASGDELQQRRGAVTLRRDEGDNAAGKVTGVQLRLPDDSVGVDVASPATAVLDGGGGAVPYGLWKADGRGGDAAAAAAARSTGARDAAAAGRAEEVLGRGAALPEAGGRAAQTRRPRPGTRVEAATLCRGEDGEDARGQLGMAEGKFPSFFFPLCLS
ncbi:unnamed protein product [Miscanthus lutarioriparius]|uniref:Uncharacterized protein n=1 Tax=Miscanthus lutarioriparius TaxID=422564 RepID=A0A811NJS5_9POAL|nr:unnamed protein product [Miscanthus lutarioriparius]